MAYTDSAKRSQFSCVGKYMDQAERQLVTVHTIARNAIGFVLPEMASFEVLVDTEGFGMGRKRVRLGSFGLVDEG